MEGLTRHDGAKTRRFIAFMKPVLKNRPQSVLFACTRNVVRSPMAEALGRVVPASRYSPSMGLHPMFRADVSARDAAFLHSWNA